jgi:hypothetical protein
MTLREHFHLTKDSFSIDNREDAAVYFGGSMLNAKLKERLETDFVRPRQVPKFCIYGAYGAGKTHTEHHIEYLLRTELADDYASEAIFLDISPIRAKEKWVKVHGDIINAIGLDLIREAATGVLTDPAAAKDPVKHLTEKGVLRYGEAAIRSSQARVFRALLFGGPMEIAALQWLKGETLTGGQAEAIEIETRLTEVSHLLACLLNVAALIKVGLGRRPILLLDEAEALRALGPGDSLNEFITAFRKLADDDNNVLGIIVAFHTEGGMEQAPEVLTDPAVFRRFGYEAAFFDLQENIGGMENVKTFIHDVLRYLIDQDAATATIAEQSLETEREFFPFTPEAIDRLAEFIAEEDPRNQVPDQIIKRMGDAVIRAWRASRDADGQIILVDDQIIEAALFPAEEA